MSESNRASDSMEKTISKNNGSGLSKNCTSCCYDTFFITFFDVR